MSRAETRTYSRVECVSFRKTDEEFGGLSNMASGFPLEVNGIAIRTSEALYQACRFPHLPKVQRLIIDEASPMTAKMKSKPYRKQSRPEWDAVRVKVMRWCLRVKLAQNWEKFGALLLDTGDRPIVEESRKDDFWGAKVHGDGVLVGANALGRLLMALREELRGASFNSFRVVEPPAIGDFMLYGDPIRGVEAGDGGAGAEDLFTMMVANRPEKQAGDRATPLAPVVSTVGARGLAASSTRAGSDAPVGASAQGYPRRLIEVDLPIKEISAHARREKSIRHGHISTLHIWWARRPLAACRAVILAALWPDPADLLCPEAFRAEAAKMMKEWRNRRGGTQRDWTDAVAVRAALLDFIADFANWDNSTNRDYLEVARRLVQVAHESLGGAPGTRPLVVDPFAGGGAIALEALRVGADAFASDLNPVAVLLNKVVLEYIPKHGIRLAEDVRRWGAWVKEEAEKELARFYPKDPDGAVPIAYLWARTIRCEGPACGAEVPLVRSLWLSKKQSRPTAMRLLPRADDSGVDVEIVERPRAADMEKGTVRRGSATCPCCDYTTPVKAVREQLKARCGGAADAKLLCVVTTRPGQTGRFYRPPSERDLGAARAAEHELARRRASDKGAMSLVPEEPLPPEGALGFRVQKYGMEHWGDLFTPRQALTMSALVQLVHRAASPGDGNGDPERTEAVRTCLSLAISRLADRCCSACTWRPQADQEKVEHVFTRQALPMTWDFAEGVPLTEGTAGWTDAYEPPARLVESLAQLNLLSATAGLCSAASHPLPDDSAHAFVTDPPYFDAVPYADLSDFFYVWHRRILAETHRSLMATETTPKENECIVDEVKGLTGEKFAATMQAAMSEGRRILAPAGVGVVVFAHKSTAGWEAQLQAMIDAGWIITASWPIDTEMGTRLRAMNSAALASSIHLVCRPRENLDGSVTSDDVGDWRAVLRELPTRIHEWMPRLAEEGVVGADAIFACLGPALEIFSRYSRVEKASGERVELRQYLEQVWAAVAKEAFSLIFSGGDATDLEPDARLTAIWFWALHVVRNGSTNASNGPDTAANTDDEKPREDQEHDEFQGVSERRAKLRGYAMEFDTARKLAQGLGVHLESLAGPQGIVEIKGSVATIRRVSDRSPLLLGAQTSLFDSEGTQSARRARKQRTRSSDIRMKAASERQEGLFDDQAKAATSGEQMALPGLFPPDTRTVVERLVDGGYTTLDRLHQAMLLFGCGQTALIGPMLIATGMATQARFWKLAQSLSALYPPGTDEKRWVDGVLARKKGLGFG